MLMCMVLAVVGFLLVGLPMYRADLPRINFQKSLRARTTAEELHSWAERTLAQTHTNQGIVAWVQIQELPAAFLGLDRSPPTAWIRDDSQGWFNYREAVPYIRITYGSAAGHFGVVLGPADLPDPPDREHEIRFTKWAPGVWFFDGK